MALPKRKHSRSRRNKRRAHWNLPLAGLTRCAQCAAMIPTHQICPHCGFYRGRQIINVSKPEKANAAS